MRRIWREHGGDVVAGVSVALVLVPQALAYAELAGVPPQVGLSASALPLIAAALVASSPYLQTGPGALTALLTLGALEGLAPTGSAEYIQLAALLAIVVGASRAVLGLLRLGPLAYLMSEPVLMGFTNAAVILIIASQLPTAVAASPPEGGVLWSAAWTIVHPADWQVDALLFALGTAAIVGVGRRHRLFPSVLVAMVLAIVVSELTGYDGSVVGSLPDDLIDFSVDLPWSRVGELILPGVVIALVGFAEAASIARRYATEDRTPWNPNRELVSQGAANLVSGVSGGIPVGGSFARSSLNRLAGARTRWSGAVTGLAVLAFLPFAGVISPLPRAVLAGIVIVAVSGLLTPRALIVLMSESKAQTIVAGGTLVATLVLAPHIELGVAIGIALSIGAHLYRELRLEDESSAEGDTLTLRPRGVLWFATANRMEQTLVDKMAAHPETTSLVIDMAGVGRIDYTAAAVLARIVSDAERGGQEVSFINVPLQSDRPLMAHFGHREDVRRGLGRSPDLDPGG